MIIARTREESTGVSLSLEKKNKIKIKIGRVMMVRRWCIVFFCLWLLMSGQRARALRQQTLPEKRMNRKKKKREKERPFCRVVITTHNHLVANPGGPITASMMMMMMKFLFGSPPHTHTLPPPSTGLWRHPFSVNAQRPEVVFNLLTNAVLAHRYSTNLFL